LTFKRDSVNGVWKVGSIKDPQAAAMAGRCGREGERERERDLQREKERKRYLQSECVCE